METAPIRQSTIVELLQELKDSGYSSSFIYKNGALRCAETEVSYDASELSTEAIYRFEGDSNPNDMTVVYVLRAKDGTGGVLVDAFGPQGDPKTAEFLSQVRDHREGRAGSEALAEIN